MRIPIFDGEGYFDISGEAVENSLNTRMPFWWLEWSAKVDWALVLLAVSGRYIPPYAVLAHAFSHLSSSSSEEEFELVILCFEEHPDWRYEKRALEKIASRISDEEWRDAKRRLLYALTYWAYVNRVTFSGWLYEAPFELNRFWDDLDQPLEDALFLDQAYEMEIGELQNFIRDHWEDCAPASSVKTIKVIRPRTLEDRKGEAVISRRLVAEPMAYLLAGSDPFLSQLRKQFRDSEIESEQYSGIGYFIDFKVRDESLRIKGFKQRVSIHDLEADIGQGPVGFILFVEDGFIRTLEAYGIDGEGWPPTGPFTNYRFHGKEGATSDLELRDWEELRCHWDLNASPRSRVSQDDLMDAFVLGPTGRAGKRTSTVTLLEWIKKGKGFSVGSFFLGPVYWVYRKCYWQALILGAVYVVGSLGLGLLVQGEADLSLPAVRLIQYTCFAIVACLFPKVYRRRFSGVLEKAREKYPADDGCLIECVAKRGGVNKIGAVLAFILFVVLVMIFGSWLPGVILGK